MEKFDLDKFLGEYSKYIGNEEAGRFNHIVRTLATPISMLEEISPQDADRNKEYLRKYIDVLNKNTKIRNKQLTTAKDLKTDIKRYVDRLVKES